MRKFIELLYESLYTPPSRHRIGDELLDETFLDVRSKVLGLLTEQKNLQFILDESPDINHRRIVNLSVMVPRFGCFFLENKGVKDETLDSSSFVNWFFYKTQLYYPDPRRISSLATNTCIVMRNSWAGL